MWCTFADLYHDPHVKARKMLVAVEHPGSARPVITPNTPIRFAQTETGVYRPRLQARRAHRRYHRRTRRPGMTPPFRPIMRPRCVAGTA